MKTSRRDFLKWSAAALAGVFAGGAGKEELPEVSIQSVWQDVEPVESVTTSTSDDPYEWRWVEGDLCSRSLSECQGKDGGCEGCLEFDGWVASGSFFIPGQPPVIWDQYADGVDAIVYLDSDDIILDFDSLLGNFLRQEKSRIKILVDFKPVPDWETEYALEVNHWPLTEDEWRVARAVDADEPATESEIWCTDDWGTTWRKPTEKEQLEFDYLLKPGRYFCRNDNT